MLSVFLCCIFAMAEEIVISSWFLYSTDVLQVIIWLKKVMATNYFISQFKLKRLSQSIWFDWIHVLLLLIVLGLFFLLNVLNIQINTIICIYFLLPKFSFKLLIFNTAPPRPHFFLGPAPLLPAVMLLLNVVCIISFIKKKHVLWLWIIFLAPHILV